MKDVVYSKTAQKTLLRIPRNWAIRIRKKINAYAADPASQANNVKALQGSEGILRLRVGDWRITMVDGVVLEILEIKPRGSAYKE
jgi:mRNA interferase RelE/StbE